ncbi:hypothetical protein LZ32DRAFT_412464 [Colletotrichum eremochloae]|nr:hypothetical protein LZ32DRAFT_412464 [Colletotrichum eremochloae]
MRHQRATSKPRRQTTISEKKTKTMRQERLDGLHAKITILIWFFLFFFFSFCLLPLLLSSFVVQTHTRPSLTRSISHVTMALLLAFFVYLRDSILCIRIMQRCLQHIRPLPFPMTQKKTPQCEAVKSSAKLNRKENQTTLTSYRGLVAIHARSLSQRRVLI